MKDKGPDQKKEGGVLEGTPAEERDDTKDDKGVLEGTPAEEQEAKSKPLKK
jgi:hypothetical protein